jgi:hypothetical protein
LRIKWSSEKSPLALWERGPGVRAGMEARKRKYFVRKNALTLTLSQRERGLMISSEDTGK